MFSGHGRKSRQAEKEESEIELLVKNGILDNFLSSVIAPAQSLKTNRCCNNHQKTIYNLFCFTCFDFRPSNGFHLCMRIVRTYHVVSLFGKLNAPVLLLLNEQKKGICEYYP